MIITGLVLLLLGIVLAIPLLSTIGIIVAIVGLVLMLVGRSRAPGRGSRSLLVTSMSAAGIGQSRNRVNNMIVGSVRDESGRLRCHVDPEAGPGFEYLSVDGELQAAGDDLYNRSSRGAVSVGSWPASKPNTVTLRLSSRWITLETTASG